MKKQKKDGERDEKTARGGRENGVECDGKNKLVKESKRQKAKPRKKRNRK